MATHLIDFRASKLPDILKGEPVGRGYRMALLYQAQANPVALDDVEVMIQVPNDEHWYVQQILVQDYTGPGNVPNGWNSLSINTDAAYFASPVGTQPTPPSGPWTPLNASLNTYIPIWQSWATGGGDVAWDDYVSTGRVGSAYRIIRCTDPVFSLPHWTPGQLLKIRSLRAKDPAGALKAITPQLVVVRYRLPDYDFKLLRQTEPDFLEKDVHMQQHYVQLGD